MLRRGPGADQTDMLASNSMNYNQQPSLVGHSNNDEAFFAYGMIRVRNRD
jgi:hypothetical protein